MKHLVFFLLGLGLIFPIHQAIADPSSDLRVIVIDPEAGGFSGAIVFSTVPSSPFLNIISSLNSEGDLDAAEHVAAFNGDIYVANVERISKINLNAQGLPDPALGANVSHITGQIFSQLLGIVADSDGMLYVADSDEQIYLVDPTGAPTASASPVVIDQQFVDIRDISIDGDFLYILDAGAENGFGGIYKIDISVPLPNYNTILVYSGDGNESLANANGIAVKNDVVFISGSSFSSFNAGILRIDSGIAEEFSDNTSGELSFPLGLTLDNDDLYVVDGPSASIYRFSGLNSIPSLPILETQSALLVSPVSLATMMAQSTAATELVIEKTVNATSAMEGDGLLYTLTVTNNGDAPVTQVLIHDNFPEGQVESVLTSLGQLSFTAEVHDVSEGTVTEIGTCVREDNGSNLYKVDCSDFGTLDVGDYVIVTLEGLVSTGAQGIAVNTAGVQNFGAPNDNDTAETQVDSPLLLTVEKSANPESVIAGDGTIDYVIRVENNDHVDALGVIITDTLPNGISELDVTSEPSPSSCQSISNEDGTTQLQCGPYTIEDGLSNFVEIHYTVNVDPDAADPLVNSVDVTCSNCVPVDPVSIPTTIIRESDLLIEKIADKTEVNAGQDSIQYTVSVTNNGISDADNVVVTDNLPDGLTFSTIGSSPECSYDSQNNVVTCNVQSVPVGATTYLIINATVNSNAGGELVNIASVTSDSTETNPDDNNVQADGITVNQQADVTITKTGPASKIAGQIITYNFTISNIGSSDAEGVYVTDELPTGLVFIPSTDVGSLTDDSCSLDAGLVTCLFGNIGSGVSQTKSIQAQILPSVSGSITNQAEVFLDTFEANTDNNISIITTTIYSDIKLSGIIRDFKIAHPDFEYVISDDDGIVKLNLGGDGEPLYNGNPFSGTVTTTGLVNYNQWYNHVNTVNDCIPYDITLVPSTTNLGYFTYTNSSFFPIDGQLFGNEHKAHNYHFTYQIHATFVYQPGQTITMTGDDDIWIFINDRLALDQGGVLPPRTGTINLDTLGLTADQTYDFDLFFAERHTVQANLGIVTNIPLIPSTPGQCKAVDAVNDSVFALTGPNTLAVTSNDVNFSSISAFTQGLHGSVSQIGTSLIYTPDLGFEGIDLFTYSITNTSGSTDTAVVTVYALTDAVCPLPPGSYNLIMGDDKNNKLRGTNGNDLILGNGGDDKIYGKNGNDCLIGGNGNDKIWGGDGNDTIISGSGNDQLFGQKDNDVMFGGSGDDKIYGSKGNDTIDAGTGNDRVHANQDNDTVLGGDGNDWLGAGIGNDTVSGGAGNDKIFGRPGNDILNGDADNDFIHAGQGDDTVNGGDGDDKIFGHQGKDILNGNDNDDYIHGGQGDDTIDGGDHDDGDRCNGAQGSNTINNCESEDKKMKEEQEENDDDEGEPEDDNNDKDKKDKK